MSVTLLKALGSAYLGCFLFGYHMGVVNAALPDIAVTLAFAGSPATQGKVVSSTLVGAFVGSLLAAGALLCALAPSVPVLLSGRLLAGIGIGAAGSIAPLYVAESAPAALRGKLGSFNQMAICVGVLAAITAGLPVGGGAQGVVTALGGSGLPWWRVMFGISLLPALAQTALLLLSTESPKWLAQNGRGSEAADVAAKLWGEGGATLAENKDSARSESSGAGWCELLQAKYCWGAAIGVLLFAFQQFAGINAVVFFSTKVFADAGVSSAVAASCLVMATNIAGTAVASSAVDKLGRKPLLIGSFSGMAAAMLFMAANMRRATTAATAASSAGLVSLVGTVGYILAFALGVGPIPSLLLGEMMPAALRGKAAAAAMASHWVCTFAVGQWFLPATAAFGNAAVYAVFGSIAAMGALFVALAVPETKSPPAAAATARLVSAD
jgi:sugar porter (SP) family MFS transporter